MTRRAVYHFTDSDGFGGAEEAMLRLVRGLDPRRWESTLVLHRSDGIEPLAERARAAGIPIWWVPTMPEGPLGVQRLPWFVRELRRLRPAVFHAHLTWPRACKFALAGAALARVPAVVATQHLYVDVRASWLARLQQRLLARGIDAYIGVSRDTARASQGLWRLPAGKLVVIHNAVGGEDYERARDPARCAELRRGARALVLSAGRLEEQKGFQFLLEAVARVPGVGLVIAGEGPSRGRLERLIAELGLEQRVALIGWRDDLVDVLACADAFVLASLWEGLPLTVIEAMAASKPVVATRVGGTAEAIVDGETGILVEPGDSEALARALQAVTDDDALAHRLGAQGRRRARRRFSLELMASRVAAVYDHALARG